MNWNNEPVNCTLNYTDIDSDGLISTNDIVSVDCEEDVLDGMYLGIADENGVAEQVSMDVPWLSPIFTISRFWEPQCWFHDEIGCYLTSVAFKHNAFHALTWRRSSGLEMSRLAHTMAPKLN